MQQVYSMRFSPASLLLLLYLRPDEVCGFNRTVRQTPCGSKYECPSGECIEQFDVCNGLAQCSDGSDELPSACGCGERTAVRSLLNAPGVRNALAGSQPWHVGVYRERLNNYLLLCSGALIYVDIVLTSAHCVIDPDTYLAYLTSALFISLGKLKKDFSVDEVHQQKFDVREVVILDHYEGEFKGYQRNLAIIKLKRSITRTHYVKPVCLWSTKSLPPGVTTGAIVGWGLQFSGNYAINLREASAGLMDVKACILKFLDPLYRKYLTTDKFCLTFDKGVGLRDEDSGGPVTIYYEGRHYLYGILSKQFGSQYGLGTLTSKHIKWIKNTTSRLKQVDNCHHYSHFNCFSDATCLRKDKICDGTKDCSDGSDEDANFCGDDFDSSGQLGKRCTIPDGAEIFNVLKCSDSSGCTNKFSAPSNSRYQITCSEGHGFATPHKKAIPIVCTDGEWTPSLQENKCLRLCKLETHGSLEITCRYLGENVSCDEMLKPETQIEVTCKRHYKKQPLVNYVDSTHCRKDGIIHNELSDCIPVCGVPFDISKSQTLISKGEELSYAKYPWHVALYWKEEQNETVQYNYKCGGTLLDSNKILTAAHCVWRAQRHKVIEAESLAVICGKLYSNWQTKDDWEQRFQVIKVILGTHYDGAKTKHSHDIAVLILNKDVKLSDHIMPACLDLDRSAGGIPNNQQGFIVGWGSLTGEDSNPSKVLMEGKMDYLDLDTCRKRFEKFGFTEYLHPDKFCGLYINGSGTQVGDSGGGMTFIHEHHHYVYGVVSIKRGGQNEFSVFTNVLSHAAWLQNILNTKPKTF